MEPKETAAKKEEGKPKDKPEEITEEEKQKLLRLSEISVWIDNYDDIFSDFDPRSYSQRAFSDDFLNETRKASKEKRTGQLELKILVPKEAKNSRHEDMIKSRFKDYFNRHLKQAEDEVTNIKKKGFLSVSIGVIMALLATYMSYVKGDGFLLNLFFVVLEPGSWFLMWSGLDTVLYTAKSKKTELDFFKRMSKCNVSFTPY